MAARARSPQLEGPPPVFVAWVRSFLMETLQGKPYQGSGQFAAQLLWQRRDLWARETVDLQGEAFETDLRPFLDPEVYGPTEPGTFGAAIAVAVQRLMTAREAKERVVIWGDFDADGVTATAVLWEGLGQFFDADPLSYTIPNRLTDSHGLNEPGLRSLAEQGVTVVVTCDTGSINIAELALAQELGIDVIVTDHHSLPTGPVPAVALINPRSLPDDHPLATLSGVAVAFKLVEALYEALPRVAAQPLENLLDLVAIGLIADLVELRGDCRYLAQRGIECLRTTTRPGLIALLKLCKRQGDRPTDIGFGIGPRINAISRIQGDAQFAVTLLTSRDRQVCQRLAAETELANSRRKELQRRLGWEIDQDLAQIDLSTTAMVVLARSGWPVGVLGLVAGQLTERLGRPVLLLAIDGEWARGSARSVDGINLYDLLERHRSLLHRYGGHPMAAGVMLKTENLTLLTQALNHDLGRRGELAPGDRHRPLDADADITVTVADLDYSLFQELKLLEPCGMGNPPPKLWLHRVWFTDIRNSNLRDSKNVKLKYIRTTFRLCDDSQPSGCAGTWWGHYQHELPTGVCNALVELDFNAHDRQYEVRLLGVESIPKEIDDDVPQPRPDLGTIRIYDWRNRSEEERYQAIATCPEEVVEVPVCPRDWPDWQSWIKRAIAHRCALALTYAGQPQDVVSQAHDAYGTFVGLAKYWVRSGEGIYRDQWQSKLGFTPALLNLGLRVLRCQGIAVDQDDTSGYLRLTEISPSDHYDNSQGDEGSQGSGAIAPREIRNFIDAIQEHIFQQNYFSTIPIQIIQTLDSSLMEPQIDRQAT